MTISPDVLRRLKFMLEHIAKDGIKDDAYLAVSVYEKSAATEHLQLAPSVGDLKAAISALEYVSSEPVAWMHKRHDGTDVTISAFDLSRQPEYIKELWKDATPLYRRDISSRSET